MGLLMTIKVEAAGHFHLVAYRPNQQRRPGHATRASRAHHPDKADKPRLADLEAPFLSAPDTSSEKHPACDLVD